ncbi:MAG: hypothetical protein Kow001_23480 [Acidobacteriota bacterium]
MSGNMKGAGKAGCVVLVLVLAIVGYLAIKIAPVYMDKINFEDDVTRIVNRAGSDNWKDPTIKQQVLRTAAGLNFELDPGDVRIERVGRFQSASRLRVVVKYRRPLEFPGYTHQFEFESHFEALIGRL